VLFVEFTNEMANDPRPHIYTMSLLHYISMHPVSIFASFILIPWSFMTFLRMAF